MKFIRGASEGAHKSEMTYQIHKQIYASHVLLQITTRAKNTDRCLQRKDLMSELLNAIFTQR